MLRTRPKNMTQIVAVAVVALLGGWSKQGALGWEKSVMMPVAAMADHRLAKTPRERYRLTGRVKQ